LYDLGSGHGTRKNKQQVNKHSYVPLADGDQIKFGESTRICIFHTEHREEEEEEEEEESKQGDEVAITMIRKRQEVPKQDNDEGITW
jgi:pSer/pThr/pTyr-binding forkhead associated (FHA) protein